MMLQSLFLLVNMFPVFKAKTYCCGCKSMPQSVTKDILLSKSLEMSPITQSKDISLGLSMLLKHC